MTRSIAKEFLLSSRPERLRKHGSVPTIDHCTGTGRLLGERYIAAIAEILRHSEKSLRPLHELCLLMRSYIVLDDHLQDCPSTLIYEDDLRTWIGRIREECSQRASTLSGGAPVWDKYIAIYSKAQCGDERQSSFEAVCGKCALMFLPFDIIEDRNVAQVRSFFARYLFALQLADDFADIEEDLDVPGNQNLFTRQINKSARMEVLRDKGSLSVPLLAYLLQHFRKMYDESLVARSATLKMHLSHAIRWINNACEEGIMTRSTPLVTHGDESFEHFQFLYGDLIRLRLQQDLPTSICDNLNAQVLHTVSH